MQKEGPLMTELLKKAIAAVGRLPESEQNVLAEQILEELADEASWDHAFADPRSGLILDQLIAHAKAQVAEGGADALDNLL